MLQSSVNHQANTIDNLRKKYHQQILRSIIRKKESNPPYYNFADAGNSTSIAIANGIVQRIGGEISVGSVVGQTAGGHFETITKEFIKDAFKQLLHIRPGDWTFNVKSLLTRFDQYEHLADLEVIIKKNRELESVLRGDYIVRPDIVIGRIAISDQEINKNNLFIDPTSNIAKYTPLRSANFSGKKEILHASISCKWTIRSDRSQNTRTEALNLIRNRKGKLPHIVVVTAEPLPTRLAALSLGTGDLDCVYHFALFELVDTVNALTNVDQLDMLNTLIEGRRLRDISDLPFDLAI